MTAARLCVVAGHDSSGGAGVTADREAAALLGVECDLVVTARTRQVRGRVEALGARPPAEWAAELSALGPARHPIWKVGLLPGAEHVRALARAWREEGPASAAEKTDATGGPSETPAAPIDPLGGWGLGMAAPGAGSGGPPPEPAPALVLDPVLAASGGEVFLDPPGQAALRAELLPLGPLVTPNLPEAALLAGLPLPELASRDGRLEAARRLLGAGARCVFLKGGHGREDPVADLVLAPGAEPVWLERPRSPGAGIHGSGCRYASLLAAGLLRGASPVEAARRAGEVVAALIEAAARGA